MILQEQAFEVGPIGSRYTPTGNLVATCMRRRQLSLPSPCPCRGQDTHLGSCWVSYFLLDSFTFLITLCMLKVHLSCSNEQNLFKTPIIWIQNDTSSFRAKCLICVASLWMQISYCMSMKHYKGKPESKQIHPFALSRSYRKRWQQWSLCTATSPPASV